MHLLTSNAGQELASKTLYLTTWERHELVPLEEIEDTLAEEIGNNTYMIAEVEAISKMDALVAVFSIVVGECRENS